MDKIKNKLARTVADIRASLVAVKEWFQRLVKAGDATDKALAQISKGIVALENAEVAARQDILKAEQEGNAVAEAYLKAWSTVSDKRHAAEAKAKRCHALLRKYSA